MQFKTIDPCFRDASLLSILSSSVLGLVLGFCGTGGNLMAMCWPFLGVGIRPWLLGLCSWSQLLLHQPCRKVADMRGCVAGQGSPLPGSIPVGWDTKSLRASTQLHSTLPLPICWGHQDVQSGLISRLNTLYVQLTGILWRTVLILSLLKTSLSHWTFWLPHWQLPLPTYFSERERPGKSCRVLGTAWGKHLIWLCLCLSELIWACPWWGGWSLNCSVSAAGAGWRKPRPSFPNQLQRTRFKSHCVGYMPCEVLCTCI